jgi:hypothetical protein
MTFGVSSLRIADALRRNVGIGIYRFVLANRDYELVRTLVFDVPASLRARRTIKRFLRPLARTDHDASFAHAQILRSIENAYSVALRKRAHDSRRFDHYERF